MEERALKALNLCIEKKWSLIVRYTTFDDKGHNNCELCKVFNHQDCTGCPINEASNGTGCVKTPYNAWINHQAEVHNNYGTKHREPGCEECLILAQKELVFLESLLSSSKDIIDERRIEDRRKEEQREDSPEGCIGRRLLYSKNRRNCKSCNRRNINAGRRIGWNNKRKIHSERRKAK